MSRHSMKSNRQLKREKKERQNAKIMRGVFSSASQGSFGFVKPDEGGIDIFIPPTGVGNAIDGDTVEVRTYFPNSAGYVQGRPSPGPVGYVEQIIDRSRELIVARMDSKHEATPLDKHLPSTIPVNSVPKGTKTGDWVQLRLLRDGKKHTERLRAGVEGTIGKAGTVKADLDAIMAEFKLEAPYTARQEQASANLKPEEIKREDLRNLYTITMDPEDAHDFDDAISLDPGDRNQWLVGVHIADVAAWIRPNSTSDKQAAIRGFSAYLPGRFLPMLPKTLTHKISLQEDRDSFAHTVLFTIRKSDGKILSFRRVHSIIRVNKRLNYPEVQRFLDDPKSAPKAWDKDLRKHLQDFAILTQRMRKLRQKQEQFLDMAVAETRAVVDESTLEVTGIERRVQSDADRMVEEFMLAANSAVAQELTEKHLPGLYRVHPEPDPVKIDEFAVQAETISGIHVGDILSSRSACQDFLASLPDDHKKPVILSAFLRALPRAYYAEEPALHYGLGKALYSHFTSPIRRYTDLLVHQQLWNADCNLRYKSKKALADLAQECSKKEESVDNAYFAANDRMKLHFLKQHHALEDGKLYESVIAKITSGGLLCDIPELGLYGFIPKSMLGGGDDYRRSRRRESARAGRSHTEYKIGDFVYLILDSLDLVQGSAIFRPAL